MKDLQTIVERAIRSFHGHSELIPVDELFEKIVAFGGELEVKELKRYIEIHSRYKLVAMPDPENRRIKWYVHEGTQTPESAIALSVTEADLLS